MKKLFILSLASMLGIQVASAQVVGGYKATTKQDIALKGATVINKDIAPGDLQGMVILTDATASGWDNATGTGFKIGFEFPFNGKSFSYFGVNAQGLIRLSETEEMTMSCSNYFCTQSNTNFDNLIFCYDKNAASYAAENEEGYEPTTISYKNTDEGLVVEWKNLGINTSSWGTNLKGVYTMQIHLMKDGSIKYRFAGLSDVQPDEAGDVTLGVRGGEGEYLNFTGFDAKKSSYGEGESFSLTPIVDGYTITLNTPGPTVTPTCQPTNLQVSTSYNRGEVTATATFDQAEGVDNYLMVISAGAPTELPADGVSYAKDDTLGNGKVILAGRPGSWGTSAYDLDHDTQYTITVYGYNSFGTEGPKYNTTEPLQASFATAPNKPGELTLVSSTPNSVKLAVGGNEKGNKIFVAYSKKVYNPENSGNRAYTGAPDATLSVGDYLTYDGIEMEWNSETYSQDTIYIHDEKAGQVAYIGEAGEFEVTGLEPSTSYYFIAYAYDEEGKVFSQGTDYSQLWTSTAITVPFKLDLTDAPENEAPGGWVSTPGDYNEGFIVDKDLDYSKVKSQTEGSYVFTCENMDNQETYKLASPMIQLTSENTISLDWHVHQMSGFFWSRKAALYDEWDEGDLLEFVVYVDGNREVLKKYDSTNAPINENVYDEDDNYDSSLDWHAESFDLSAYAGKNVQLGIEWKGAYSSTLYLGVENIQVSGTATGTDMLAAPVAAKRQATYNLKGQQVPANSRGIVVSENKKVLR